MSSRRLAKTASRRFQDVIKKSCKNVFKISSRRLQDIFKASCQDVFKTSSKRLQVDLQKLLHDIFKTSSRRLQGIFKTSCKDVFKTFSRGVIRLNCFPRSRICLQPPKKIVAKTKNFPFPQLSMLPLVMRWKEPEGNNI